MKRLAENSSTQLKMALGTQETTQNGSNRLLIESGLFDDEGFLAGLGRKLIKRIKTGTS